MTTRRTVLRVASAAPLLAAPAVAQVPYPARPVTALAGFAPGVGTDIIARLLQPLLLQDLGQPIAIENRPVASGTIAAAAVTRAQPDGHTLLLTTTGGTRADAAARLRRDATRSATRC